MQQTIYNAHAPNWLHYLHAIVFIWIWNVQHFVLAIKIKKQQTIIIKKTQKKTIKTTRDRYRLPDCSWKSNTRQRNRSNERNEILWFWLIALFSLHLPYCLIFETATKIRQLRSQTEEKDQWTFFWHASVFYLRVLIGFYFQLSKHSFTLKKNGKKLFQWWWENRVSKYLCIFYRYVEESKRNTEHPPIACVLFNYN